MNHRRHNRQRDGFVPVAADVLEVRALLSAGATAVHAAQHHAVSLEQTIAPSAFKGNVLADIKLGTLTDFPNVPGNFSLSNVKLAVGSKVSAHFSFTLSTGGSTLSLKGAFDGKITHFATVGQITEVALAPTGGSLVLSIKSPGHKAETGKAVPNGSPIDLVLAAADGTFLAMSATDVLPANAPPPLGGLPVKMLIVI